MISKSTWTRYALGLSSTCLSLSLVYCIPGFKDEVFEMKYLRYLSTQTKANFSNFLLLLVAKHPFHRPLHASSISNIFFIQKPLVSVFNTPMNLKPRFLSLSSYCNEANYLYALKTRRCLFTHGCKRLSIALVPCNNPSYYSGEWRSSSEKSLTSFNWIMIPEILQHHSEYDIYFQDFYELQYAASECNLSSDLQSHTIWT